MEEGTPWPALAERLPQLVEAQFAAYRRLAYADTGPEDGPRELVAWENARKAALAHLQALIRIYDLVQGQLARGAGPSEAGEPALTGLLAEVRQELAAQADDDGKFHGEFQGELHGEFDG